MKFAFSTVSCPRWDFETIVSRAKEYGYDGVEVRGFLNENILTAANVFLTDPAKVRDLFDSAGIEICCLASSVLWSGNRRKDAVTAQDLRTYIDTAQKIGCRMVKVFDGQVPPGYSRGSVGVALGDWILPLGDYAADHDVVIVMENALSFRASKELWGILDRLSHPSIAACWDVFNAALIGESPFLSVPTLNNKIQYTQVKDAKLGPMGALYTKLGEGDVAVQKFLTRLMGIGYTGYVTMEWEKAWLPAIAEPEEILPDAIAKMRLWTKPAGEEEEAEADSAPGNAQMSGHGVQAV
jgi:sugar phosphate isomerase/epimerase